MNRNKKLAKRMFDLQLFADSTSISRGNAEALIPVQESHLQMSNLDIEMYDTVFIGYPVWAVRVPQAVLSFLAEYDLSGKTVIPFCTHDGYGAGCK